MTCVEGTCAPAVACADCALVLRMTERSVAGGVIERVVLAVDWQPKESEPNPRMMDLRLTLPSAGGVVAVEAGSALIDAEKSLSLGETNGQAWRVGADGSVQIVAYSVGNTREIETGRLLTLTVALAHPGPLDFRILRHTETFAPSGADAALQATAYDNMLTVTQ